MEASHSALPADQVPHIFQSAISLQSFSCTFSLPTQKRIKWINPILASTQLAEPQSEKSSSEETGIKSREFKYTSPFDYIFPPEPSALQQEQPMTYTHEKINHSLSVTNKQRDVLKCLMCMWNGGTLFLKLKFLVTCSVNPSGWCLPSGMLYQLHSLSLNIAKLQLTEGF